MKLHIAAGAGLTWSIAAASVNLHDEKKTLILASAAIFSSLLPFLCCLIGAGYRSVCMQQPRRGVMCQALTDVW